MKALLVGINAKYIHSSLAIRTIGAYLNRYAPAVDLQLAEYTINMRYDTILREIYEQRADIIGFSCYIWNISLIKPLIADLKKLNPKLFVFLGGPEVSYKPDEMLAQYGGDCIISGEGEAAALSLLQALEKGEQPQRIIYGEPQPLESIPFPYGDNLSQELKNRIVYYETSRGCPFNCGYCLSGKDGGVRALSIERVCREIDFFIEQEIPLVKLTDRTFNYDKARALSIWKHISDHDKGKTRFHFELAAELLDDRTLDFLKTVRKGLFQFEIGVQSTNPKTLEEINRITLPDRLSTLLGRLQEPDNIHIHLDLIAGLPYEGLKEFAISFNFVYSLAPQQLQLGFLKLLKGSPLELNCNGLVCSENPPYEVLCTEWLSADELLLLKNVEAMVEKYYNSGRFKLEIDYLLSFFPTPFDCYQALGNHFFEKDYHLKLQNKNDDYEILFEFADKIGGGEILSHLALFDIYSHENPTKLPRFLEKTQNGYYRQIRSLCENGDFRAKYLGGLEQLDLKQLLRHINIGVFPFNPLNYSEKGERIYLFSHTSPPVDITNEFKGTT